MTGFSDARGTNMRHFKQQPARIISLVPSQTELLYHLGLHKEVVGITKFCVHPQEWYRSKTRIGGTKNINLNIITNLKPDLIIANKEENVKEQVEELAEKFPVWVTDVNNLDNALEMIEDFGTLTGKDSAATFLKAHIATGFKNLKSNQPPLKFRVCYLIWKDPYLTVGGDTFIHAMLEQAGVENIFADQKRYPEVTIEMLQSINCDVLLLSSEPYPFAQKHIELLQPQLPYTKIILVDGELFSWYGSRLQWAPAYFRLLYKQIDTLIN